MTQQSLNGFDVLPSKEKLSPGRKRTQQRARRLAAGIHPLTGRKLREPVGEQTCGSCTHRRENSHGYYKCNLVSTSHSEATDLRLSWPACDLWRAVGA